MTQRALSFLVAASLWLTLFAAPPAAAGTRVALKLVFAVDASDSIEDWEWRLELDGIAAALRDKDVQAAIDALPTHSVAVALLAWADLDGPRPNTGFKLIDSSAAADRFAGTVETFQRLTGGGTAMGEGVAASIRLMARAPFEANRQVVDVSGDGQEPISFFTEKVMFMDRARALADSSGVIINGLSIDKQWPELFDWYRQNVATGPGAFVMHVATMRDFAASFKLKLLRELSAEVSENEQSRAVLASAGIEEKK
jgi:Protein of unknown function (DUF1194)